MGKLAHRSQPAERIKDNVDYPSFLQAVQRAKRQNKERLALYIAKTLNVVVNPDALFDVQIKRIHEYKRQLLNVLHVITLYNRLLDDPEIERVPRVVIFAGKAASAYYAAKQIIRLINDVAKVINNDPRVHTQLKVVFIPNYGVSWRRSLSRRRICRNRSRWRAPKPQAPAT